MRLLCDTCIYGIMINDNEVNTMIEKIQSSGRFKINGFDVIKRELRREGRDKSRLTGLYDQLMNAKDYPEYQKITRLAEEYYREFKNFGGTSPKQKIINDFKIIACASLYYMNVVVSEDEKTMLGLLSKKAYDRVNAAKKIKTPEFWKYPRFKKEILKL